MSESDKPTFIGTIAEIGSLRGGAPSILLQLASFSDAREIAKHLYEAVEITIRVDEPEPEPEPA